MTAMLRLLALPVVVLALALAGCGKKIWITQYPVFETAEIKGVAVVPFRNLTPNRFAGEIVSDHLCSALMQNGTYVHVYNRSHLKTLMDERDLKLALSDDSAAAASSLRKVASVQAVLVGSVTTYAVSTHTEIMKFPQYAKDAYGNTYVAGYTEIPMTTNEGDVAATAALIRVSDGSTIYAMPVPAQAKVTSQNGKSMQACLADATSQAVWQLLSSFAVVRREITVNPDKDFRLASEIYDNKWTYKDSFAASDDRMFVVLRLPVNCDRNRFRVTIIREGERHDLAEQDIVWSKDFGDEKSPGRGFEFSPRQIAAKGGGPGKYVVKFYSGPEPVMLRNFTIR